MLKKPKDHKLITIGRTIVSVGSISWGIPIKRFRNFFVISSKTVKYRSFVKSSFEGMATLDAVKICEFCVSFS